MDHINQIITDIKVMEKKLLDFDEIFNEIKDKWKIIFLFTIVFSIIGVTISLIAPIEFTSSTKLLPKTSSSTSSSISGLANLTGFNLLNGLGSDENIPSQLFPEIAQSIPFKINLSNSYLKFKESNITIREYLLNEYMDLNYNNDFEYYFEENNSFKLSSSEKLLHELISDVVSIDVDERKGLVLISSTTKHPEISSQLTNIASSNLQSIIIDFQTKKSKDELNFLMERKEEIFLEREKKKNLLIQFEDKNLNLVSNKTKIMLQDLQNDFNLIDEVYKQISQELESQKIKVKKQTPVFSIIEPSFVPIERSKPVRTKIVRLWFAFGILSGIIFILLSMLKDKLFKRNG